MCVLGRGGGLGGCFKLPTSTRIQALNFQYKELICQQFSGSIMCIVWAKHKNQFRKPLF